MTLAHPRLSTARRLIAKIERLTSIRFETASDWKFEQLRRNVQERQTKEWRWQLTCGMFGLVVGSCYRVNEVMTAYRLRVVAGDGELDVIVTDL